MPDAPQFTTGDLDPVCRMHVELPRVVLDYGGHRFAFCSDACAGRFRAEPQTFVGALGP